MQLEKNDDDKMENNNPESKKTKDIKKIKETLKDNMSLDNKQKEKDKKVEVTGKKDGDYKTKRMQTRLRERRYLYQFPQMLLLSFLSLYGLKMET